MDETTPVAPGSKRGELRVTAEKAWAATGNYADFVWNFVAVFCLLLVFVMER